MKKIIVIAFLIFGAFTANAQLLQFGIKAGPNFSDLDGDIDSEGRTGFHIGAIAEIKAGANFAIQPELLYSAQGSKFRSGIFIGEESKVNYDYLTVPVVLKYYILTDLLSIEAGPQFSFLINDDQPQALNDPSTFDFAILGGAGVDITKSIFVQARYVIGLTSAAEFDTGFSSQDITNRVIQLSVGYKF